MAEPRSFLIIEDDPDGDLLLQRPLLRKFPSAQIEICRDGDDALRVLQGRPWTGVIVHRALDASGPDMIKRIRQLDRMTKVLLVSGREPAGSAEAAGADHFVPYHEWQRVGDFFA